MNKHDKFNILFLIKLTSLWILAFLISVLVFVFQKQTGPTYPFKGKYEYNQHLYKYKLERSSENLNDALIKLSAPQGSSGLLYYQRFNSDDEWKATRMRYENDHLVGFIPKQAAAGKMKYYIVLNLKDYQMRIPEKSNIILRFKGHVPMGLLIPHILFMVISVLVVIKSCLDVLFNLTSAKVNFAVGTVSMVIGGMLLGPIIQRLAFGDWWTGWPFGGDWTDSKVGFMMIILLIGNLIIWTKNRISSKVVIKTAIIFSTLAMLVIYMIPHSFRGSNLDYKTGVVNTGKIDQH